MTTRHYGKRHVDGTLLAGGRCAESGGLMDGLTEVSGERALESISYEHS
jgi:hypothetical protein